jgi:PhnB protein
MPEHARAQSSIVPYLVMTQCADAIEFYKSVFGARELFRTASPDGKVDHAELDIGGARVMLADAHAGASVQSPAALGGTTITLTLYVDDADRVVDQAVAAGAHIDDPVKEKPYGDRSGTIIDPVGHRWTIATHRREVAPRELERI